MSSQQDAPQAIEVREKVKATYLPLLRGVGLLTALCAFLLFLKGFIFGGVSWEAAAAVFFLANFALAKIFPTEQETKTKSLRLGDWVLFTYVTILGLGFNWLWAFLWFSRRYSFFSTQIIALAILVMAFWAAVALIVGLLTKRNWRTALLVFAAGPCIVASFFMRVHLLVR
jgi:hypothetical protein